MGQQPNVPLSSEDLPRPEPRPGAPRRWRAGRPGDLTSPAEVPWGGAFGTPGPDAGYALRLLAGRPREVAPGERLADVEAALAALMTARASRLGRAPVAADADVAEMLLGYRASGAPAATAARTALPVRGAEGVRRLLEAVDSGLLAAPAPEVARRLAAGEGPAD